MTGTVNAQIAPVISLTVRRARANLVEAIGRFWSDLFKIESKVILSLGSPHQRAGGDPGGFGHHVDGGVSWTCRR